MRKSIKLLTLCLLPALACAQDYEQTETGIRTAVNGGSVNLEVQWFTPRSVRILKTPQGKDVKKQSLSVIAEPQNPGIKISTDKGDNVTMRSKELSVTVNTQNGVVTYAKPDGTVLLAEKENNKPFTATNDAGRNTYIVYQGFAVGQDEGLYGLGQLQNGKMMQRNMTKALAQGNTEDVTPFFQSTKGYGVFWDNYSVTTYTDNQQETSFSSIVGDCIDYYFMYGGSADGVIAEARALTGEVPMMPLWSSSLTLLLRGE